MRLRIFSSVSAIVLIALVPLAAQAAFEFVAPNGQQASEQLQEEKKAPAFDASVMPIVPEGAVESAALPEPTPAPMPLVERSAPAFDLSPIPLTPVVHDSDALVVETKPHIKPVIKANDLPPLPSVAKSEPKMAALPPIMSDSTVEQGPAVQGFGKDVPLVLALQQIVPPNYRYSFDPTVNPGMRVSWTGGQSWKGVLMEVARNNDMNVDIVSNVVAFRRYMPTDIIADTSATPGDTVMGMPLKPVAPEKAKEPFPYEVMMPSPVQNEQPMALVPSMPPEQKRTVIASKSETVHTSANAFDPLMNDKPAGKPVEEKKILTAEDEPAIAPLMPLAPQPIVKETTVTSTTSSVMTQPMPAPMPEPKPLPPVSEPMPAAGAPMPLMPPAGAMPAPVAQSAAMMAADAPKEINVASDLTTPQEWTARKGDTLRQALTAWSERAGVSLVWSSEFDYPLQTDLRIDAGYADAVRTLLAGFSKAQPRPFGRLFNNSQVGAQAVLSVETQRLTN